jgi:hypothetical protein
VRADSTDDAAAESFDLVALGGASVALRAAHGQ